MNRLLRAVDENEKFYNVDNYTKNTPDNLIKTYQDMQDEAFRIQKEMHIRIKDLMLLDLSPLEIKKIMRNSGVSDELSNNLFFGKFTPVNYSQKRFETKVNTIETELRKMSDDRVSFFLNRQFVFPKFELNNIKIQNNFRRFFEPGDEYNPEEFDYKVDKNGNFVLDENGNPIKEEGFIKRQLRKISPIIRKGADKLLNPLSNAFRAEIPPLPITPQPIVPPNQLTQNTNLTRTEEALLSPDEKVIARTT